MSVLSRCMLASGCFAIGMLLKTQVSGASESTRQFEDWAVHCQSNQENLPDCRMFQRLVLNDSDQLAVQLLVLPPTKVSAAAQLVLLLPLGLYLPGGVSISVDGGKSHQPVIERCFTQGCTARSTLVEQFLNALKKGSEAEIVIQEEPDQDVTLPVSLTGFTAAYRALLQSIR